MRWLLDALYLLALLALSPWLLYRALRTGRYRQGLKVKLLGLPAHHVAAFAQNAGDVAAFAKNAAIVWFHGVSVGEIHLLRQVIAAFRQRRPDLRCVVSATTDTGLAEARRCFAELAVFPFPFDFSWAVTRTLKRVRPALVVLAEGELWPNFLLAARRLGVPVALVNGRMSPRSFARYRRLGWLARWMFRVPELLAVQTQEYAEALHRLGAPAQRVVVTGSVKYDGALTDPHNGRTQELRRLFGVTAADLVWVAGSTQAPEEEVVLGIYERVKGARAHLRLFVVPRQRDRFDEVARLLERRGVAFVRRSRVHDRDAARVVLVDTIGELGALWGLADVAFVGGSLDGRRGGQNMIEPAAFGAAVVFGPHVWNFRDTAARLVEAGGACRVEDEAELGRVVERLLGDAEERRRRGAAGRAFVLRQQGATEQTVRLLDGLLASRAASRAA
jgi:3-deoxy-D-manno-octulosonic-acid transferase